MKQLLNFFTVILAILLCFFLGKLLLPLFAPFLPALAAAAILEPAVRSLCRKNCPRKLATGIMTLVLLCAAGGLIVICTSSSAHILTDYARKAPLLLRQFTGSLTEAQTRLDRLLGHLPAPLVRQLSEAAQGLTENLEHFPLWASRKLLQLLSALARSSPDLLLFTCSLLLGIYCFSAYYPDIRAFCRRQIPEELQGKLTVIWSVTVGAGLSFFKVQLIISAVSFGILLLAFRLMGLSAPACSAAAVALIDALPVLGAGLILLPWAGLRFLLGETGTALWLLCIYGLLLLSRNLLQAKLLGDRLGLHPVAALVSLYVGYQLKGFWGMLILPILCVLLARLNRAGIIRIYR